MTATTTQTGNLTTTATVFSQDLESGPADNTASANVMVAPPPPTDAQPPTALVASSIVGNSVTLRWTAPAMDPRRPPTS